MNSCWLAILVCVASPEADVSRPLPTVTPAFEEETASSEAPPQFYESDPETDARLAAYALKVRVSEALKSEATSEGDDHDAAICELAAVYCALQNSPPLAEEELLRLRTQVRSRLQRIARHLRVIEKRQPTGITSDSTIETPHLESSASVAFRTLEEASKGGAAGGAAQEDYGKDLVELIETVIAPHTWEKNGGFGSIYYYSPLRVIVVRSTGEIHGQVGGAIQNLRAAGN